MAKLSIQRDDKVLVIGGKDRGKKGKALRVLPRESRVVVEGINFIKRHTRATQRRVQGGIIEREASLHISNVKLICPSCGQATRVSKRKTEEGKRIRVCKKCGADVDKP